MSDNKKEQERAELHKTIWGIANDLRGSVDGWDFKQYVLGMLFYRYISENLTNYINKDEIAAGDLDFDYSKLTDEMAEEIREDTVNTKGFFVTVF
jgi:type I restriction enzyme M protein